MTNLTLSIAMGDYDRTRPIHDGRVKIDGVNPITQLLSPEEMFFRAFRHEAFDVSELSFSSYCVKRAQGLLPMWQFRSFCRALFVILRSISVPTGNQGPVRSQGPSHWHR